MNAATTLWLMTPEAPDWPTSLEDLLARPAWMTDAACRGMGHEEFIVSESHLPLPAVRRLCEGCPVREPCLDFALGHKNLKGIWGGTTSREREAMR